MSGTIDRWIGAMSAMGFNAHTTGAPNLDATESGDGLFNFWRATNSNPVICARMMFPECPKGYVSATQDLGHYAANRSTAMACRKRGDINAALNYERITDIIYERLPNFARW